MLEIGSVLGTKAARTALKKAMQPMFQEVVNSAPINTGVLNGIHLRDCIKLKISGRTNKHRKQGSDTFLSASIYTTGPLMITLALLNSGAMPTWLNAIRCLDVRPASIKSTSELLLQIPSCAMHSTNMPSPPRKLSSTALWTKSGESQQIETKLHNRK